MERLWHTAYGIRELLKAWSQEDTFLSKGAVAYFWSENYFAHYKVGGIGFVSYGCSCDELMALGLEKVFFFPYEWLL